MNVTDKLAEIARLAIEIKQEDETLGNIVLEGIGMSFNIINAIKEGKVDEAMDVSEKIQVVSDILGFNLEELIMGAFEEVNQMSDKAVVEETMNFITAQTDDYETFLKENKADAVKDTIAELRSEI